MELGCSVLSFLRKHPKSIEGNFGCGASNHPYIPKGDLNAGGNSGCAKPKL
jgi:hypothetical protein